MLLWLLALEHENRSPPDQSLTPISFNTLIDKATIMITILSSKIKYISPFTYLNFINSISLNQLPCSCGISGSLIKHAYYRRSIKTNRGIRSLYILRMKCKHCGKTHAILPSSIVPYSRILLSDQLTILRIFHNHASFDPFMMANEWIDESNIQYIIRQFLRHWKERITAFGLSLSLHPLALSKHCLLSLRRQFMQIKSTPNFLPTHSHIT